MVYWVGMIGKCQDEFCRKETDRLVKYKVSSWVVMLLCRACVDMRMRYKLGLPAN